MPTHRGQIRYIYLCFVLDSWCGVCDSNSHASKRLNVFHSHGSIHQQTLCQPCLFAHRGCAGCFRCIQWAHCSCISEAFHSSSKHMHVTDDKHHEGHHGLEAYHKPICRVARHLQRDWCHSYMKPRLGIWAGCFFWFCRFSPRYYVHI